MKVKFEWFKVNVLYKMTTFNGQLLKGVSIKMLVFFIKYRTDTKGGYTVLKVR